MLICMLLDYYENCREGSLSFPGNFTLKIPRNLIKKHTHSPSMPSCLWNQFSIFRFFITRKIFPSHLHNVIFAWDFTFSCLVSLSIMMAEFSQCSCFVFLLRSWNNFLMTAALNGEWQFTENCFTLTIDQGKIQWIFHVCEHLQALRTNFEAAHVRFV